MIILLYSKWLYIIDKNDTLQRNLSGYYKEMINEKKDTIHVFLKEILFLYIFT